MPRNDGTGPLGQGPMTGRGEGYCAIVLPESGQAPYGYAGIPGTPVDAAAAAPGVGTTLPYASQRRPKLRSRLAFRRGRCHGWMRARGRGFGR